MSQSPEMNLQEALIGALEASKRKCTVRQDPGGGLAIMFYEHLRGFWRCDPSGYVFYASREGAATYRCHTVAEAVQFTLEGVCQT